MQNTHSIAEPWAWIGFIIFVVIMLAVDLFALGGRKAHKVSLKEASTWSLVWVTLALTFAAGLWFYLAHSTTNSVATVKTTEFLTGYLLEKSLSIDNLFVFLLVFSSLGVPEALQRRVLLYGVLGAIILRGIMILAGAWLVAEFHWVLYVFGAILIWSGLKMFKPNSQEQKLEEQWIYRIAQKTLPITNHYHGEKFWVRHNAKLYLTPLALALLMIELSDVIFAVDSIPAIFSVTNDPFIVFTSNMFAILGLRALYFLVSNMANRFQLLQPAVALILLFIGSKMLISHWVHISSVISFAIILGVLFIAVAASLFMAKKSATSK